MPNVLKTFGSYPDKELRDQQVRKVTDMAGSIHLDDIATPALDTATQRLGDSSSAEHEATFEHQAFDGEPAASGSRSMPGSFPQETPPPSPTASMHTAIENFEDPIQGEAHAPAMTPDVDEGPHTPPASDVNHGTQPVSDDGERPHACDHQR